MKAVLKYVSTDGAEWDTAEEATARDILDGIVCDLEALLQPHPDGPGQRVRQPRADGVKQAVVVICRQLYPRQSIFREEVVHSMSYAGRFSSDVGGPLGRIWWRFCCMHEGWEYQQPYYALNPDKFKGTIVFGFIKRFLCPHATFTPWHVVTRVLFTPVLGTTRDEVQQRECTACGYIQRAEIKVAR